MIYRYNCLLSEFGLLNVVMAARGLYENGAMTDKQYIVFRMYVIEQLDIYKISIMLDRNKSTISRHLRIVYNKLYTKLRCL